MSKTENYIPTIGDVIQLKNDLVDFIYPDVRNMSECTRVIRSRKGEKDIVTGVLFDPLSRSYMITLENIDAHIIWDTNIELINK